MCVFFCAKILKNGGTALIKSFAYETLKPKWENEKYLDI